MIQKGYFWWVSKYILISAHLAIASFYACPAFRLDRKVDRWYSKWKTNEWMAEWMTNLSLKKKKKEKKKKRACMHVRSGMIMNKMKAEDTIKNKTSKVKQKRPLTPRQTGIAAKPRDNSEISEGVKVSNSTVLLKVYLFFSLALFAQTRGKTEYIFYGIIVDGRM